MEKSIKSAFTYMFQDSDWKFKFLVLVLLLFPVTYLMYVVYINKTMPNMVILTILAVLSPLILLLISGYFVKLTNIVINAKTNEEIILPSWECDIWSYFLLGFKKVIAALLIQLALIPGNFLLSIPSFIYGILYMPLDNIFCTEQKLVSFFAWKKAFNIIRADVAKYFKIVSLWVVLEFVFGLLIVLLYFLKANSIAVGILTSLIGAYLSYFFAYLVGLFTSSEEVKAVQEI